MKNLVENLKIIEKIIKIYEKFRSGETFILPELQSVETWEKFL